MISLSILLPSTVPRIRPGGAGRPKGRTCSASNRCLTIDSRWPATGHRASAPCWPARSRCPSQLSDLTALVVDDDHPGAGLAFSRTLGEAVLVYADVAVRRGRDRMGIRADLAHRMPAPAHSSAVQGGRFAVLREFEHRRRLYARTRESPSTSSTTSTPTGIRAGEWDEIVRSDRPKATRHASDERFREARQAGNLLRMSAQFARSHHEASLRIPQSARHPDLFGRGSRAGDDHAPRPGGPQRKPGAAPGARARARACCSVWRRVGCTAAISTNLQCAPRGCRARSTSPPTSERTSDRWPRV